MNRSEAIEIFAQPEHFAMHNASDVDGSMMLLLGRRGLEEKRQFQRKQTNALGFMQPTA